MPKGPANLQWVQNLLDFFCKHMATLPNFINSCPCCWSSMKEAGARIQCSQQYPVAFTLSKLILWLFQKLKISLIFTFPALSHVGISLFCSRHLWSLLPDKAFFLCEICSPIHKVGPSNPIFTTLSCSLARLYWTRNGNLAQAGPFIFALSELELD